MRVSDHWLPFEQLLSFRFTSAPAFFEALFFFFALRVNAFYVEKLSLLGTFLCVFVYRLCHFCSDAWVLSGFEEQVLTIRRFIVFLFADTTAANFLQGNENENCSLVVTLACLQARCSHRFKKLMKYVGICKIDLALVYDRICCKSVSSKSSTRRQAQLNYERGG